MREGPQLESLTRRLAETPADFLAEPQIGRRGTVNVAAVAADLMREFGSELAPAQLSTFTSKQKADRNHLRLILVACWLLGDPAFTQDQNLAPQVCEFLSNGLAEPARLTSAEKFVSDPDRREELARLCLHALGLRPAGETEAQAQDRLATLNTAERQRVIAAARAAEKRAREVRRQMAEDAARAAEAKYMPE